MKNILDDKKGIEIAMSNILYLLWVIVLFSVLIYSLSSSSGSVPVLEQEYAKQVTLILDSAEPGMVVRLDMVDGLEISKDRGFDFAKVVAVNKDSNEVTVGFGDNRGYSYKYFTDYDVDVFPEPNQKSGEYTGYYVININELEENE